MNNPFHVYIIAEAGVNHNGSVDMAMQLVDVAVEAGADAVKFQTFKAEKLASKSAEKAAYQIRNTDVAESQFEMLKKLELDESAHKKLVRYCAMKKIQFLSTPFDWESLDLLINKFDLPYIKIPSGEITNAPFLLDIAKKHKPVILSTGMSTLGEIEQALGVLAFGYIDSDNAPNTSAFENAYVSVKGRQAIADNVILLHCTTEYPAPFQDVNLRAMDTLQKAFSLPVGYSDHTVGIIVPIAAVALGAVMIEKHFTLDRNLSGPDHKASLEPEELKKMVEAIRQVEIAMGTSLKQPSAVELQNRLIGRKSLVAAKRISKGDRFSSENLTVKRPGKGVSPIRYWEWLGKTAGQDYMPDDEV
jgi:N-acetylneuraminate synthase